MTKEAERTQKSTATSTGPLSGIKVLDLTTVIMGPLATMILGDFGADVIKVESHEGDITRNVSPMRSPGMGHLFLNSNRNKRSIALNLKNAAARDALLKLVLNADVLVHNIRSESIERLGLDYDVISKIKPDIVYAQAVGYGSKGRYAGKPAYDDLIQGLAALPSLMQEAGSDVPRYLPTPIADRAVGLYLVAVISAALAHRARTGRGQMIEVPMFEVLTQFVLGDHMGGLTFDPPIGDPHYGRLISHERKPFATKDGYICVLVYNDKHWQSLFRIIGEESKFASDARFSSHTARMQNVDAVYLFVADILKKRTSAEWITVLEEADIPAMPLHSVRTLVQDPHLEDVNFFPILNHPTEGKLRTTGIPTNWSDSPPEIRMLAPKLGEHSVEILRSLKMSDSEIECALEINLSYKSNV